MNYKLIHDKIIERAINRTLNCYSERHHIIPKCIGGTNEKCNIVRLTAKEHWLIHLLLIEIYPDIPGLKFAINRMMYKSNNQKRDYINSGKKFERIRKTIAIEQSKLLKGKKRIFTNEHCKNISKSKKGRPNGTLGLKRNEETKRKIGLSSKGRMSGEKNHMKTKEHKLRLSKNNPMHSNEVIKKFQGKNNPNSKKVMFHEVIYETVNDCISNLKISRSEFYRKVHKNEIFYI